MVVGLNLNQIIFCRKDATPIRIQKKSRTIWREVDEAYHSTHLGKNEGYTLSYWHLIIMV
jgi:hypothetical protein